MIHRQPAIYKLQNKRTGDIYVGGTGNAQGRKRQHEYDLRRERHRNPKLQTAYNDGDRFAFSVLEYLPPEWTDDEIIRREQEWSDFLRPSLNSRSARPKFGSDIELARDRKLAGKRTTPQTEEEKARRAASVKKYWSTHKRRQLTEEEKETISRRLKENPPRKGAILSQELKDRISDSNSRTEYTFISPSGELIIFRNLRRFCKENNLIEWKMQKLSDGRLKPENCAGWTFKEKKFLGYKKER